jgi:putative PIN family toxin of toxin-antitoxin system
LNTASIVIDTNVLLDLWVFEDPTVAPLRVALDKGVCFALRSRETDAELLDVLARPQFGLSADRQQSLLVAWRRRALLIERVFPAPWQCTDPHDQPFLDLAMTAHAQVLVTKDKALLRLYRKVRSADLRIVRPGALAGLIVVRDGPIDISA